LMCFQKKYFHTSRDLSAAMVSAAVVVAVTNNKQEKQ
jgi:hypothetical protein